MGVNYDAHVENNAHPNFEHRYFVDDHYLSRKEIQQRFNHNDPQVLKHADVTVDSRVFRDYLISRPEYTNLVKKSPS